MCINIRAEWYLRLGAVRFGGFDHRLVLQAAHVLSWLERTSRGLALDAGLKRTIVRQARSSAVESEVSEQSRGPPSESHSRSRFGCRVHGERIQPLKLRQQMRLVIINPDGIRRCEQSDMLWQCGGLERYGIEPVLVVASCRGTLAEFRIDTELEMMVDGKLNIETEV